MEERTRYILLYDYYETLFTLKQKAYFEDYYFNNLSLGEISLNYNVSRNAVYQQLKRVEVKLEEYESKLKLYEKGLKLDKIIKMIDNPNLKALLKEIE